MRLPIVIRPARTFLYAFALAIAYVAGAYLGGALLAIWYAMLALPLLSMTQAIITAAALRYHQEFSNDHPAKGEAVGYTLSVTNESPIPSAKITASFHMGRIEYGTSTSLLQLGAHRTTTIEHTVRCPYRGVYTVGLSRLTVWDIFGWIGFGLPVFSRTFYVYPRILHLPHAFAGFGTEHAVAQALTAGVEPDVTLYRGLRPYRLDDDVRHISWRKLALLGEPVVREYDTAAEPAVTICLDTRPVVSRERTLDVEDGAIEMVVALAKHYADREVPVAMAIGADVVRIGGGDANAFVRFHSSTIRIFFRSRVSPAIVYETHRHDGRFSDGTVIFVTDRLDADVIDLVETSDGRNLQAAAIINTIGLDDRERRRAAAIQRSLRDRAGAIVTVESADELVQELAQTHGARA